MDKDWLTGLYTRSEMERLITEALRDGKEGTLILLDICSFSRFNEKYGHLKGDKILQSAAAAIGSILKEAFIAGRVGPDKFAVYMPGDCAEEEIDLVKKSMRDKVSNIGKELGIEEETESIIICAKGEHGESGCDLLNKGDMLLLSEHRIAKMPYLNGGESAYRDDSCGDDAPVCRDMEIISQELVERGDIKGAYLQDYTSFKQIYRFVERGLRRSKDSAYILLLTLDGQEKPGFIMPDDKEEIMEILFQVIKSELRCGDAFTQYSSCQYLLMVLSTSGENAVKIGERIRRSFNKVVSYQYELKLNIDACPLQNSSL